MTIISNEKIICKCGKEEDKRAPSHKYCTECTKARRKEQSRDCHRRKVSKIKAANKKLKTFVCAICGKDFKAKNKRELCGQYECYKKRARNYQKEFRKNNPVPKKPKKVKNVIVVKPPKKDKLILPKFFTFDNGEYVFNYKYIDGGGCSGCTFHNHKTSKKINCVLYPDISSM